MNKYFKKDERLNAEKQLRNYQIARNNKVPFCPIIKEQCNKDCICYNAPSLSEVTGRRSDTSTEIQVISYNVYDWSCSHVLISGTIYTN